MLKQIKSVFKKNPRILRYFLIIGFLGFTYFFLYQILVGQDFVGVKYKINLTEQADEFYLLSGWVKDKSVKFNIPYEVIWNKDSRSALALFLPGKESYKINLKVFFPDYGLKEKQEVKIYGEGKLLAALSPRELNTWQDYGFLLSYKYIKEDINKFRFISNSDKPIAYKSVEISNYQPKKIIFPRGYMLWEGAQWMSKRPGKPVDWHFCLLGFFLLPVGWFFYSYAIRFISVLDFENTLKINLFSLIPSWLVFAVLYFISRIFYYYTIFYYKLDFWLIVICLTGSIQVYFIFRYVRVPQVVIKAKTYLSDIKFYTQVLGNIFMISFMVLFLSCIVPLVFGNEKIAEELGNWGYLLLIMGAGLKFIEFIINKKADG